MKNDKERQLMVWTGTKEELKAKLQDVWLVRIGLKTEPLGTDEEYRTIYIYDTNLPHVFVWSGFPLSGQHQIALDLEQPEKFVRLDEPTKPSLRLV